MLKYVNYFGFSSQHNCVCVCGGGGRGSMYICGLDEHENLRFENEEDIFMSFEN